MMMHQFWVQNGPFPPNNFFFLKIINITLIYLLATFIVQNFKQILTANPECHEDVSFLGPKWFVCPKQIFFWEKKYYHFHVPIGPVHSAKNFKNFLDPIQSYEDVPFLGPKFPNLSWSVFFWNKPLLLLSSTYWRFSLGKILKEFLQQMRHFWAQRGPFASNIFFWKLLISLSPTY